MAWRALAITDIRLTPQEKATMENIQGSTDIKSTILTNVIREFVGAIRAGGYEVVDDDTIPDLVRNHVINRTRWLWLVEFPQLKIFQTPEREKLNQAAEDALAKISNRELNVEPPTAVTASGNWNSENKIVGRTHPIPRPGTQYQGNETGYANPDAPADSTISD